MHNFLVNLIIGIIGGIFSSVIVTRVFLIRSELEDQIEILKMTVYRFGSIKAYFDVIEEILKLSSDTSSEIEQEIQKDPSYLSTHDIIHAGDAINSIKATLLDKTINEICNQDVSFVLKNHEYKKLQYEAIQTIQKYKEIKEFKFKTIDTCKKEVQELEHKYNQCFKEKGKEFIRLLFKDKILIALACIFVLLCILSVIPN